MSDADKPMPHIGPQAARAQAERAAREAAALRENLRRRKAQAQVRDKLARDDPAAISDASKPLDLG